MEINATIFVTTLSFLAFIFVMNAILYKPVMQIMEKRQKYIEDNKNEAEKHRKKAHALIEDKDSKVADAQRKSRDIVASKADALKEEKSKVLNDTKQSVSAYFNEQKQILAHQKEDTTQNMKSSIADLANRLTSKLLGSGVAFEPLKEQELEETFGEVIRKNA